MNCKHNDCKSEATHVPKVCVPATGWPLNVHEPMSMIAGVELCLLHCQKFDAEDFLRLNPKLKEIITTMLAGKCPPDFARVFSKPLPMTSDEYQLMAGQRAKQPDPTDKVST